MYEELMRIIKLYELLENKQIANVFKQAIKLFEENNLNEANLLDFASIIESATIEEGE